MPDDATHHIYRSEILESNADFLCGGYLSLATFAHSRNFGSRTPDFFSSYLSSRRAEIFLGSAFYLLNAGFLLGFLLDLENRGDMFLRSID
jgi:hypothetical protein